MRPHCNVAILSNLDFADDFQMMVATGRQKFLTILFMVFLGTILIYKAWSSHKVNNFQIRNNNTISAPNKLRLLKLLQIYHSNLDAIIGYLVYILALSLYFVVEALSSSE